MPDAKKAASDVARLLSCLLSYSSVILAYIGGLQQAAAVSGADGLPRSGSPWPVALRAARVARAKSCKNWKTFLMLSSSPA